MRVGGEIIVYHQLQSTIALMMLPRRYYPSQQPPRREAMPPEPSKSKFPIKTLSLARIYGNRPTLISLLYNISTKYLTTHPPSLPAELLLFLIISGFSHPLLPLISLALSEGGSQSATACRWDARRSAFPSRSAIYILVWFEESARRGR